MTLAGTLLLLLLISMPAAGQEGPSSEPDDPLADFEALFRQEERTRWTPSLSTGFDALLHTYPLATSDTTETITETFVAVGLEGRSARGGRHQWRVRGEVSAGSELYRQRLEAGWKWRDGSRRTRLRLDADLQGRQYRAGTGYSLSSDNAEGDLTARLVPWLGRDRQLEIRADAGLAEYSEPSTLEARHRETGAGLQLGSRLLAEAPWRLGYRYMRRLYPDSTGIDRHTHALEGEVDLQDDSARSLRLFHRSGRRLIRDESLKPSAWTHWTDMGARVPVAAGDIYVDLQSEIWSYDQPTDVYLDSWRLDGVLGYHRGDLLRAGWRAGLAWERFDAGDSPETYTQVGLLAGLESYGHRLGGSVQLEYGRRHYTQGAESTTATAIADYLEDIDLTYSDFHYVEIWIMAGWTIDSHFRLDVMASYEPESHTEKDDDTSLGYASLRLVWRP